MARGPSEAAARLAQVARRHSPSCDGRTYTPAMESRINQLVGGTFASEAGMECLAYLDSLTIRRALGPEAGDGELRHLEGARWLVAVIHERIAKSKEDGRG